MEAGYRGEFATRTDLSNPAVGSEIHHVWAARTDDPWHGDPYFYRHLGQMANRLGQPMFAIDVLSEAVQIFPDDVRLRQLFALAQIRCGFLTRARVLLSDLVKQGHNDEETLGILGRVYKERWQRSGENPSHGDLRRSRNLYLKAFLRSRGYYSGINAATLSMIMGDHHNAGKIARAVVGICKRALAKQPDYWAMATLGEACVLIGRSDDAAVWYQKASPLIRRNLADIASTRRQLKLLSRHIDVQPELLDVLSIPNVVAFSGHLVDSHDRKRPRFPSQAAEEVKRRIAATLDELNAGIGYSSAGCGADVLFLECMQERGAESNVVLPFDREDFFRTSVDFAGRAWRERTERVLEKSSQVRQAAQGLYAGDDILFSYTNQVIMGRAILRGRLLDTESVLLVVWNREKKRLAGGTGEFVKMWERRGGTAKIVDISGLKATDAAPIKIKPPVVSAKAAESGAFGARRLKRDTRALLFADIVGFSKLSEQQFPRFVQGLLGTLSRRQKRFRPKPDFKNIWGDAVYFVFESVPAAAEHALDLRDMMRETNWSDLGLPTDLTMRIGLHAGPVYLAKEPVLGRINYFGHHVNHAARIEPITTPGNVYASEQFAALITAEPQDRIECNYVGEIVLPKDFGSHPIYLVSRKDELE